MKNTLLSTYFAYIILSIRLMRTPQGNMVILYDDGTKKKNTQKKKKNVKYFGFSIEISKKSNYND